MVGNANANGVPFIKNGTSFLKDNIVLWYDLKRQGATNENMANNPILKDLSGNGHDATCYNFAWNRMSGIGGYTTNFNDWSISSSGTLDELSHNSFTITSTTGNRYMSVIAIDANEVTFKFKVSGLTEGNILIRQRDTDIIDLTIEEDGIYEVHSRMCGITSSTKRDSCNIKIELIPEYPNALVSDGVDDYCRVDGLPILTDYTVIAKRKRLDVDLGHRGALASKLPQGSSSNGAFAFEYSSADDVKQAVSFGTFNIINFEETDISYQTKNYYNGVNIQSGNILDTDHLTLFSIREHSGCAQAAIYSFVLFNRTLTEDEIKKWIRINMDKDYLLDTNKVN